MAIHLLEALRHIKTHGPQVPDAGVCVNVANRLFDTCSIKELEAAMSEFRSLLLQWPDRKPSENDGEPVEGSRDKYLADRNKWQNPRRIALLDWLIAQLEQEVQHDN